jgi:hypothetical protein
MTVSPIGESILGPFDDTSSDTGKRPRYPKYPQNGRNMPEMGPKWVENGSKMGEICRIYPLPIILSRKKRGMGRGYYLRGKLDPGKIILVSFGPKNCR